MCVRRSSLCVIRDLYLGVTRVVFMCDIWHICVCGRLIPACSGAFVCVTCICVCGATYSCVWWCIAMCDMAHFYVCLAFVYVVRLIPVRGGALLCVTWRISMCDLHLCVWCDLFLCVARLIYMHDTTHSCVWWRIAMWDMAHFYVCLACKGCNLVLCFSAVWHANTLNTHKTNT